MENSSVVVSEMGLPREAEIAARLERATRSVLASSSLASYSYSQSHAREELASQIPSLADLLTHVGPPDCPRCPSCQAPLPFGPRSRLCLACDATFIEISPPSITSSVAFRCFSEGLGLETDFGVAEEHFQDKEANNVNKPSASSFSAPGARGMQKESLHAPLDLKTSSKEAVTGNDFPHTSTSGDFSSVPPPEAELPTAKQPNILDYSHKLEGISLEDFFSNQTKQEAPTPSKSDTISVNISGALTSVATPGIQVRKDSLFWDPLSETIIPDGFDMMASTSEPITNKGPAWEKMVEVEEDDDPFSSWEGDFQSAPPATTGPSTSHTSEGQSLVQPGEFEDFFGSAANNKERCDGESVGIQGNNGWANNAHCFGSNTDTTVGRSVDVDDLLFGSEWQQNVQPSAILATNGSQSSNFFDGDDMFGTFSSLPNETSLSDSRVDSLQEENSTATENQPLTEPQASQAAGKKNNIVGSLLAQLHDLSFMLTDKLVIKTEEKNTKSDSSS
ncbi:hypothetical protein GOP47_0020334 [Adiantum capillus-veneris]|uniref:Uncharacterized protein n=1 Tax=Adiantum capillus-veneris TaxID=13818 RepID=A0A9D4UE48_ADICA|nr:hypothetical protein GOP47_0020334 [Adiantum capillus-veneris]